MRPKLALQLLNLPFELLGVVGGQLFGDQLGRRRQADAFGSRTGQLQEFVGSDAVRLVERQGDSYNFV